MTKAIEAAHGITGEHMSDYHYFGLFAMIFIARAQSPSAAWVLGLIFFAVAVYLKVAA